VRPATPHRLGATPDADGTGFALWSDAAESVELCLLDTDASGVLAETRFTLPHREGPVWHGYLTGIRPGQRYGYRIHGPWLPDSGMLANPNKLLIDPYAHSIAGDLIYAPEIYAHLSEDALGRGDLTQRDDRDSAGFVPHGVVTQAPERTTDRPAIPWPKTVIYEAHVRGLTARNTDIPEGDRGTYRALGHPSVIEYLQRLGVTTLELLPLHHFVTEPHVASRGRINHWGYNPIALSAPHAGYAATADPITELQQSIDALHAGGIEVLLDVVYNHSAEGGITGPMLSFKGIDNRAYYRTNSYGQYEDLTGCGNTLDTRSPYVTRFVADSLRWWAQVIGVDGFRFDLISAISRTEQGFDTRAQLLTVIAQDPLLRELKLIAEPWDISLDGYGVGSFPEPWHEWNDRYRDSVRKFWLDSHQPHHRAGIREIAYRVSGSSDLYSRRDPTASVNFITAHDGFTMQDLVTWSEKRNDPNGEGNADGTNENHSWNCGIEGETTHEGVFGIRRRLHRSLMATLLLSAGIPMITMGDEVGRRQNGSNNAYTLTAEGDVLDDWGGGWALDWDLAPWQEHLLETTQSLTVLRSLHPLLSQNEFFTGRLNPVTLRKDLAWFGSDGEEMTEAAWHDPRVHTFGYHIEAVGSETDSLLVILHSAMTDTRFSLPGSPWAQTLRLVLDTSIERPAGEQKRVDGGTRVRVAAHSVQVWLVETPEA
jgi:isoamylase